MARQKKVGRPGKPAKRRREDQLDGDRREQDQNKSGQEGDLMGRADIEKKEIIQARSLITAKNTRSFKKENCRGKHVAERPRHLTENIGGRIPKKVKSVRELGGMTRASGDCSHQLRGRGQNREKSLTHRGKLSDARPR